MAFEWTPDHIKTLIALWNEVIPRAKSDLVWGSRRMRLLAKYIDWGCQSAVLQSSQSRKRSLMLYLWRNSAQVCVCGRQAIRRRMISIFVAIELQLDAHTAIRIVTART